MSCNASIGRFEAAALLHSHVVRVRVVSALHVLRLVHDGHRGHRRFSAEETPFLVHVVTNLGSSSWMNLRHNHCHVIGFAASLKVEVVFACF